MVLSSQRRKTNSVVVNNQKMHVQRNAILVLLGVIAQQCCANASASTVTADRQLLGGVDPSAAALPLRGGTIEGENTVIAAMMIGGDDRNESSSSFVVKNQRSGRSLLKEAPQQRPWWRKLSHMPIILDRSLKNKAKQQRSRQVVEKEAAGVNGYWKPEQRFLAFGDYADPTFNCPATITCRVVCVAAKEDCPQDSLCPDGSELCADGNCAEAGTACDAELESPCECDALSVACARQVDAKDLCKERFQSFYDGETECLELQEDSIPQVDFKGPAFVACAVIICLSTLLMLVWCAYNQRWARVKGSTVDLENAMDVNVGSSTMGAVSMSRRMESSMSGEESTTQSSVNGGIYQHWTQTGYKTTFVGMSLYVLIILIHLGIQYLLLALTVEYYVQQESCTVYFFGKQIFYDELQVLRAFEIVWMVGLVWCFFLKYPMTIHSIFLRRCLHNQANYIAVTAPVQDLDAHYKKKWIANLLSRSSSVFLGVMSFLYSDTTRKEGNKVTFCKVRVDEGTGSRYFYFRMRRYVYDDVTQKFIPGKWELDGTIGQWLDESYLREGLSSDEGVKRRGVVGRNVLDLQRPSLFRSFATEFGKPFYLYQNFMVWTWAPFWYYYMAIVQTFVRGTAGVASAVSKYIGDRTLYKLMVTEGSMHVVRGGEVVEVNQTDVVPGDIVRLTPGLAFVDMAILQAKNIIVDESALTGEVHPIAKSPLDPANSAKAYDPKTNKSSTISAGTTILECSDAEGKLGDLAIVTRTGSFTAKGELLCDVLSYERHKFKFDTEVKVVLAWLCVEAAILLAVVMHFLQDNWEYRWFYAMFVVGTIFPPLLPSVFVVSVSTSRARLAKKRISCIDDQGILVAGKVNKAFFDKTGTLTNQGLDFVSALSGSELEDKQIETIGVKDPVLKRGIAVCHMLHPSKSGALIGTAVDQTGFAATSAKMISETSIKLAGGETVEYLKRFEFNHHSMTQSVIIRHGSETVVYAKGSPEAISKLCVESSIPANFEEKAQNFARNGIYQLAYGTASFTSSKAIHDVTREDIEKNLSFAGVINFENKLRKETPAVIQELSEGSVESAIVTGDNVLTGLFIAKMAGLVPSDRPAIIGHKIVDGRVSWINESGNPVSEPMIPTLKSFSRSTTIALTGKVWSYLLKYDPKTALEYAKHSKVFGRCTPNDKVSIVSTFVEIGDITLMCGDGGNDCGALKAAHVGIALSDAEASVVAPFTSLDKTITSVTAVLKEGRCALASAFAAYKYMIMYGQIESINQTVNAYLSITFSEWCWVFMDGIWTLTLAFSLPLAKAAKKLSPKWPSGSILGTHTLTSAIGILVINFLFLVFGLSALWHQDWFQCRKWDSTDVSVVTDIGDNYETSVIFIISGYQYIASAAAFNFGYTFRKNWFKNYIFVFFFLLWTAFQLGVTLSASSFSCLFRLNCDNEHVVRSVTTTEPEAIKNIYNTTVMPMSFRAGLVVLMFFNLICVCAWDYYVVNTFLPRFRKKLGMSDNSQHAGIESRFLKEDIVSDSSKADVVNGFMDKSVEKAEGARIEMA